MPHYLNTLHVSVIMSPIHSTNSQWLVARN